MAGTTSSLGQVGLVQKEELTAAQKVFDIRILLIDIINGLTPQDILELLVVSVAAGEKLLTANLSDKPYFSTSAPRQLCTSNLKLPCTLSGIRVLYPSLTPTHTSSSTTVYSCKKMTDTTKVSNHKLRLLQAGYVGKASGPGHYRFGTDDLPDQITSQQFYRRSATKPPPSSGPPIQTVAMNPLILSKRYTTHLFGGTKDRADLKPTVFPYTPLATWPRGSSCYKTFVTDPPTTRLTVKLRTIGRDFSMTVPIFQILRQAMQVVEDLEGIKSGKVIEALQKCYETIISQSVRTGAGKVNVEFGALIILDEGTVFWKYWD